MNHPTQDQCDQAKRAHEAITRELALLMQEGHQPADLVAGACAAVAQMIDQIYGAGTAGRTFANQAAMLRSAEGPAD
jgi:hypothetical protein